MSNIHRLFDIATAEIARISSGTQPVNGLPSGIGLERYVPGGIPRGKLTAVYSCEGNFKTTLVAQMAYAAASAGYTVLNLTLEDSAELVVHRFLARITGVPYGAIHGGTLTEDQVELIVAARLTDTAKRMLVVDDLEPRWDRVEAAVAAVGKCDAVILDYVQMFGRDPALLDAAVFNAQRLAKAANIAIIFVSQQTKPEHGTADPRPQTANMFGSSALRMGCKLAVGLFRPSAHCKAPTALKGSFAPYAKWITTNPANIDIYPNLLEIHITKNFAGPPAAFHVEVNPETGVMQPYFIENFV